MKPEDPGPMKDKKVKEELRGKNLPMIEDGIKNLQKAIEIDPNYDDAMAYLNLIVSRARRLGGFARGVQER